MSTSRRHTEERLAELFSEYVDRLAEGTAPSIEQFLDEHRDVADELRPLLKLSGEVARAPCLEEAHAGFSATAAEAAFNSIRGKFLAEAERDALRASVEKGQGAVDLNKRPDFLLLLLRAAGEVWGKTKLVKLLFLLGKETKSGEMVPDFFRHVAYDFGPFDDAIYRDIEALENAGLIEVRQPARRASADRGVDAVYRLTARGKKFADALSRGAEQSNTAVVDEVKDIAQKYGRMTLRELLRYVYRTYPEYTVNSKIRDEILGDDES